MREHTKPKRIRTDALPLICGQCSTSNPATALVCTACGTSLRPLRATRQLDRAESQIMAGQFDQAASSLILADVEMLNLSQHEREQHLFSARAFWLQGMIYYNKSMLAEAREELLRAELSLRQLDYAQVFRAEVLNRLGNVSYYQSRLDESASYYQQAYALATSLEAATTAAKIASNYAALLLEQGDFAAAIPIFSDALAHAKVGGNQTNLAQIYVTLAWVHGQYGPATLSLQYARDVYTLRGAIENREVRCIVISEAADCFTRYGDYATAGNYTREAHRLIEATEDQLGRLSLATSVSELRWYGQHEEWFANALHPLLEAMADPVNRREVALPLARYHILSGDKPACRRHLQFLQPIKPRSDQETVNIGLARALLHTTLGEWEQAATHYTALLALMEEHNLSRYELASTWEEYAMMLQGRAAAEASDYHAQAARNALANAADLYRQLEMPLRVVRVEAMLSSANSRTLVGMLG